MTRRAKTPRRRTPGQLGTVEALPSGRWRAFYRRDGRKFTAPRTFATKAEGNAWLAGEFADRSRGVWRDPDAGRVLLREYAATWLATRPDLAPRTQDYYARTLRAWVLPRVGATGTARGVELGGMDVSDITAAVVRAWFAAVFTQARETASARLTRNKGRAPHPARLWARESGMAVATSGRLSPAVLTAWEQAGSPQGRPSGELRTVVPMDSAGRTTAAQAYRVLRTVLATAVTDGLLSFNPCQIKGGGVVSHRERGTASPAEVAELAALMPPRLAAATTLAAWSGLRYGELFALARRHVDLEAGTVKVERAIEHVPGQPIRFGKPKTDKSRRTVALPAFAVADLRKHLGEHVAPNPDALLFATTDGRPVPNVHVSVAFRAARAVIGREDLTWHDLRHTGATLAYRAGASMPEVMRRLGHTTPRAASIYAHAADDSDAVLARRLDELFADTTMAAARRLRAL